MDTQLRSIRLWLLFLCLSFGQGLTISAGPFTRAHAQTTDSQRAQATVRQQSQTTAVQPEQTEDRISARGPAANPEQTLGTTPSQTPINPARSVGVESELGKRAQTPADTKVDTKSDTKTDTKTDVSPETKPTGTTSRPNEMSPEASVVATPADLEYMFDLGFRIMRHKYLYKFLNEQFADNISRPGKDRLWGLSLTQMVFILYHAGRANRQNWQELENYLREVPQEIAESPEVEEKRKRFREMFSSFSQNKKIMDRLKRQNDATLPLLVRPPSGRSIVDMDVYFNHVGLSDPNDPRSERVSSTDLRQLVIDFIGGANREVIYNVFDFDLKPIAEALVDARSRNVSVLGGIDAGTVKQKPKVQEIVDYLSKFEGENFKTVLVESVGLNHQKIIVRDPGTPNAAVLFLSGNFTQSCLGPEGDAINWPEKSRPSFSRPNANHALLIKGEIPAAVTRQELRKTLVYGIRGESQYPLGGAILMHGPDDPKTKSPTSVTLTFAPNGGLGDIGRDVLTRLIRLTRGLMVITQFVMSSDRLGAEMIERLQRDLKTAAKDERFRIIQEFVKMTGDTSFAMREYSTFLQLSGLKRNLETGKYESDPDSPLRQFLSASELKALQTQVRTAPLYYGRRTVKGPDGKDEELTAKIHHKLMLFLKHHISVIGASFNATANAEKNNEQLPIVKSSKILEKAHQYVSWLFHQSQGSVAAEAQRRNRLPHRKDRVDTNEEREVGLDLVPQAVRCEALFAS